jgi:hypothetical protein
MCIYSQTTYACRHNIETLTELCDLGKQYKPSMHDKIIIGIHESKDKCEACGGPHPVLIDLTQDVNNPIDLTKDDVHDHADFSQDPDAPSDQDFEHQGFPIDPQLSSSSKKRSRRDSGLTDYPVLPHTDAPVDSHPAPMDTSA